MASSEARAAEGSAGVSNVLPFPLRSPAAQSPGSHLAARLLERPPTCSHAVQFYDDHGFLLETVARFIVCGLAVGDSVLVIATREHTDGIIERLGKALVVGAFAEKRLVLADADAVLARFIVGGEVSVPALGNALDLVLRDLPAAEAGGPFRAFGEMVDRLWQQGQAAAAIQLEEAWCDLCDKRQIALLCGYAMSNFNKHDESQRFHEVCRLHSHVLPTEKFARSTGSDFDRLREISLLEQRERLLQGEVFYREQLEHALRELSHTGALRDLLEPASEIGAIARALGSRYSHPSASDDIARLNAALERLQHATARLQSHGVAPRRAEASAALNPRARPR